ncbi:hypothetical protein NEMBOFW57_003175 [Staphylotrichum longicolle]|uniref:CMP/dCMP-type deaminase domain-containing protein n=1 Tax=Staphylotrichum longicolle TaxID=669026 RepID=A0AAD4F4U1_9PEZI|nr:hypothetical protein NEMBOFW57_003175 [Staphylotrichum longicolle]
MHAYSVLSWIYRLPNALLSQSQAAKATAYCPYSNFRVGAVLLTASGAYVPGANVENASYPVGTCAERVALGRAVTEGHHRGGFRAVAIREFCDLSVPIIMFDKDSNYVVMKLEELLPLSFGPEALGAPDPAKPQAGQA